MRYLLDLCVFAEVMRTAPDATLVAWLERAEPAGFAVAAVVMAEVHEAAACRGSGFGRNILNDWVCDLVEAFGAAILPFDAKAAQAFGRLRAMEENKTRLFSVADAQTAATAEAHGLILATRDASRFGLWGGAVVDPWVAP
jgi:predicted nucleic acid-binding protein